MLSHITCDIRFQLGFINQQDTINKEQIRPLFLLSLINNFPIGYFFYKHIEELSSTFIKTITGDVIKGKEAECSFIRANYRLLCHLECQLRDALCL